MSKQTYHVALYSEALQLVEASESYADPTRSLDRYDMLRIEASRRGGDWRAYKGDKAYAWPTEAELAASKATARRSEILARLSGIDYESLRALRATSLGMATDTDTAKLDSLESEATALRAELSALPVEALNA